MKLSIPTFLKSPMAEHAHFATHSPFLSGLLALILLVSALPGSAAPPPKAEVQKLTAVLQSQASQKEKADACRELARIADRDAVASLAALLPDEALSHMARYALETIPSPEVDKAFRAAAEKLHGRPLVGVIGSIGVRKDVKAVKTLSRLLNDQDVDVAQASARALGKIGTPAAAKAIQNALPLTTEANQVAFCEGLFRCAESLMNKGDRKLAASIYDSLRKSQAGHQIRTAALRGAILARQEKGLPILKETLASSDYAVFAAAARTSVEMTGKGVTEALTAQFPKVSADSQILLTQILAKRGDPAALPTLKTAAENCERPVRVAAIRAISEFGDSSTADSLVRLMRDQDREVAQAAQEALAGLQGKAADAAVLAMLRSNDESQRTTGMELVVRRRMTSALPDLYSLASASDPKLRVIAVRRLAELSDERETPGMLNLLSKAKTPEDIEAAEQALATIALKATNRDATAQKLAASFPNAEPGQRCALVRVLGALGTPASLKVVRTAVTDSSPEVRASAIRTLGSWSSAETAPDLLQLARSASDPGDKALSLRNYLRLASQAELPIDTRLSMCRDAAALVQTTDEKKLLLAALGNVHSPDAFQLILPYFKESGTRDEASVACLGVAGKLLEGNDASKNAAAVIEALQNASQDGSESDFSAKARGLIEKAKAKSAAK